MGQDGGSEHLWRLVGAVLGEASATEYECDLCDQVLVVPAGQLPPPTI